MTLSAYRLGLDAITGGALPVIRGLIRSLYSPDERDESLARLVPVLTEVIRNSRTEAYAEATMFLAETAADQGVDAPYIPAQSGYSEASVRSILREDLRGSADEAVEIIAPKLIQHIEDSARQTMVRAVEDYREPGTREDADHYSYAALRGTDNVDRSFRESQARSWARVLTGAENCAFCVTLASRGPVYETAEDAGRLSASKKFKTAIAIGYVNSFHNSCDCLVVPVYNYASWPGREQYRALDEFYQRVMKDPLWHGERTGTDPRSKDAPGSSGNPALAAIERELRHMAQQGESLPITDLRTGEPMRTASGSIAA